MKQTAVRWLIEQLTSLDISNISDEQWFGIMGEAEAKFEQQIIDAHTQGMNDEAGSTIRLSEEYFAETYGE